MYHGTNDPIILDRSFLLVNGYLNVSCVLMGDGGAIKKLLKAMSQPVEADVFLLQPQSRANAVVTQIVVEVPLFGRQSVQVRH